MRIPWPTPLHEQLRHSSTRAERERFQSLVETISFRKSDVHIARGELSVMIRRPAAQRFIGCLGIPSHSNRRCGTACRAKQAHRSLCALIADRA